MRYNTHPPQKVQFLQIFWGILLISLALALKIPELQQRQGLHASPIEPSSQTAKQDSSILGQTSHPLNPSNPIKYETELLTASLIGGIIFFILTGLAALWAAFSLAQFHAAPNGYFCFSNEQFIALLLFFLAGMLSLLFLTLGIQLLFMAIAGKRTYSSPIENMIRYSNNIQYCEKQILIDKENLSWGKKKLKNQLKLDKLLLRLPKHIKRTHKKIANLERKTASPNIFRSKSRTEDYLEELEILKKELEIYKSLQKTAITDRETMMKQIDLIESTYQARPYGFYKRAQMRQKERNLLK